MGTYQRHHGIEDIPVATFTTFVEKNFPIFVHNSIIIEFNVSFVAAFVLVYYM